MSLPPATKLHPPTSLYVGDLLPTVTENTLRDFFRSSGVEASSLRLCRYASSDPYNPKTASTYAYVNFQSEEDAEKVLDTLNHSPIMGKACRIMWQMRDPSIRRSPIGNIFIKNLHPSIGPKELSDTFSQFGDILSCKVATDENGNSKGYAFVHFSTHESAEKAINATNHMSLKDQEVHVAPFKRKKDRMQSIQSSWTNLYVKGIDRSVTEDELRKSFEEFGEITSHLLVDNKHKEGKDTNYAYINFKRHEDAVKAQEARHKFVLKGRELWCDRHQKKSERLLGLYRSRKVKNNLYIKNLEDDVDEETLRKAFTNEAFSPIQSVKVMTYNGISRGFGFVCLTTSEGAQAAIAAMHKQPLPGRFKPLYVAFAESKAIREKKLISRFYYKSNKQPRSNYTVFYPPPSNPAPFFYPPQPAMVRSRPWQSPYSMPSAPFPLPPQPLNVSSRPRTHNPQSWSRPQSRKGNAQHFDQYQDPALEEIKKYPEEQQKLLLGEKFYPIVCETQPDLAGKITGMLLDSGWNIEDLFRLLNDRTLLEARIAEAVSILDKVKYRQNLPEGHH